VIKRTLNLGSQRISIFFQQRDLLLAQTQKGRQNSKGHGGHPSHFKMSALIIEPPNRRRFI
jgi:hypothetical protein